MSSEFDQYFQKFLADDYNEFESFLGDDFNDEPEGEVSHNNDWDFGNRAVSISSPNILEGPEERSSAIDTENSGLTEGMLMPDIDSQFGTATRNEFETAAHLKAHWKEKAEQWRHGLKTCDWPDCVSRASFKSPSALKSHIFNIHVTPLVCKHPRCTYSKPFGKACDLRRHMESVHEASRDHICPVESCEASIKGFARKDKLLKHIKEDHDNLRCPYSHCHASILETDQDKHLQQFHGSFECALGACKNTPASRFTELGLKGHFRSHHNATYDPTKTLIHRVVGTMDHTARMSHIFLATKWKDCPDCCSEEPGYLLTEMRAQQ